MAVDVGTVTTLLRNDLRQLLRSPRTLFMSVVLPLLVWPLMLWISSLATERQQEREETTTYRYVVSGPQAEAGRGWLERATGSVQGEQTSESPRFEEVSSAETSGEPEAALEEETVEVWVIAQPPAGTDDSTAAPKEPTSSEEDPPVTADLELRLLYRGDIEASRAGEQRLEDALDAALRRERLELLGARGQPVDPDRLIELDSTDLATAEQTSGMALGRFLTLMTILFLLSGGSVVAMDTLAGEKERGTLETLLTTGASRLEIVISKSLAIFIVGLVITVVQVANLLIWIGLDLIPLPEGFTIPVTVPVALLLVVLLLPLAALVSSALLIVSARAKTYKEAQLLFFPLFLAASLPTLVVFLPGVELRSALVVVPIANLSVAIRDVLAGDADWLFVALAWLVNAALAGWLAYLSIRALSSERLLTAADTDEADLFGGPRLFARRVLRWFAVLWSVFLVWQLSVGPDTDVRLIVATNMTLFVAATWLMIRRYRLEPRQALALRPVSAPVWLAVALGAPATIVLGQAVAQAASWFLEVPPEVLERFSNLLLPERLSTGQLLFFVALLPGICEELAFRGVLLHGLRWRHSPMVTALLSAAVFSLFHVDLFRLAPTFFLGLVLATVTLLTGSIWPAVLWHILNNGIAILVDRFADPEALVDATAWLIPLAVLLFAASVALLWRFGGRYPDPRLGGTDETRRSSDASGEIAA